MIKKIKNGTKELSWISYDTFKNNLVLKYLHTERIIVMLLWKIGNSTKCVTGR